MLNRSEMEKLRSYDYDKVALAIANACRDKGNCADETVYAAAYVLWQVSENRRININEMEYYLEDAQETGDRSLFIHKALDGCWKSVAELSNRFTSDELKATLLFYDGKASRGSDTVTPTGVARLAARLIGLKPGMKVVDCCTGPGVFLRECSILEPGATYTGIDKNPVITMIAGIRAEILGTDITLQTRDLFDGDADDRQYDAAFANYPLGIRAREAGSFAGEYLAKKGSAFARLSSMDWAFNQRAREFVGGSGRVICIMANGSTWNTIDRAARRYFVSGGSVEMVISLPPRIFEGTNVATTMIVFSHGNEKMMMVDATQLCEKGRRMNEITDTNIETILQACTHESEISRYVTIREVADNQYNLSPAAYLEGEEETIENGVELGSVVSITRGAQLQASALDEMASSVATDYQYLMLSNIQNGIIDDDLPYLREIDSKLEKYCLKHNNLLLSKNGAPFKIAVAEVQPGQHILANGNLYVMTVDETKADPYFIKAYLESEKGVAALKRITVGTTIPNLGVEQLKKLMIPLPPLDEQKRIADEYRACIMELKTLRRKTAKILDRMGHVYDNSKEG